MADGAKLATGWLELTVSTAGAQKSITESIVPGATKAGDQAGSSIGSQLLGGLKKFAGPIAAVVAGFSVAKVLKDSEKAFMDLAGATNALQRIAGGSKEQVSGLRAAMQLSGVDADKATGALTIFSKNLGNAAGDADKAAAMQQKLGTAFLDAAGQVKPMSEILPGLADKFKSMPDGAEKTALATQLFGRAGAQMLPFLNKGSEGIAQLTDKAKQMGLVIDDVSAQAFAKAKASQREYNMSLQGLMVTLGGNLLPITTAFGNIYRQSVIPIIQAATGFLGSHRDAFLAVASGAQAFADKAGAAISGVFNILVKGDFTSAFGDAFGIAEDSRIVDVLFTIRETVLGVFDSLKGPLGEVGSMFGQVFAELGPLFAQLLPVFGQLLPPLVQLWQAFSPLTLILNAITPVLPTLVGLLGQVATTVGGLLGQVLVALVPPLVQVASVLSNALITAFMALMPTIEALIPIVVQIVEVLGGVFGAVIEALVPLLLMIVDLFVKLLPTIMPLITAVLGLAEPIGQLVLALVPLIGGLLPPLIQLFIAILTPILGLIEPLIGLLVPALQLVADVLAVVIDWVAKAIDWVVQFVTGNNDAGQQFQNTWNTVMSFFQGVGRYIGAIWDGLINGISAMVGNVVKIFQDIPNKIGELFAGAGKWLWDAGKNIVDGLLNGAKSVLSSIGKFFLDMVPDWIKEPFKAALGIHSPSTVFYGYGDNTVQGYVNAWADRKRDLQKAVDSAAPTMSPQSTRVVGDVAWSAATGRGAQEQAPMFVLQGITTEETAQQLAERIEEKRRRRQRRSGVLQLAGVR